MSQLAVYRQTTINNYVTKKRHFTQSSIKDYAVPKRRVPSSFTGHTSVSDVNNGNKFVKQPLDMLGCVTAFLGNKDKVNLFSTCKSMYRDSSRCVALYPFQFKRRPNLYNVFERHLHKFCTDCDVGEKCTTSLARYTNLSPLISGIQKARHDMSHKHDLRNWLTTLPSLTNLTNLELSIYGKSYYDIVSDIPIPNSVKVLHIQQFSEECNYKLGDNLERLYIRYRALSKLKRNSVITLPSNLLVFSFESGDNAINDSRFESIVLPSSVKYLRLYGNYDFTLRGHVNTFSVIPEHVEYLDISQMYNLIKGVDTTNLWNFVDDIKLPNGLKMLKLPYYTGYNIREVCNLQQLTVIDFGTMFNQSLQGITLPTSLKTIIFGSEYNKPFPKYIFHEGLENLYLPNKEFIQNSPVVLPSTLRLFSFGSIWLTSFRCFILPLNLHRLELQECKTNLWCINLTHTNLVEIVIDYYKPSLVNQIIFPQSLRLMRLRYKCRYEEDSILRVLPDCRVVTGVIETEQYVQPIPDITFYA